MDRQCSSRQWKHVLAITAVLLASITARAEPAASLYAATPPLLNQTSDSLTMSVMSVDYGLFKRADGVITFDQALFQPKLTVNDRTVHWGGLLHALFVDDNGFLREDRNGNDRLDDYGTDNIVELIVDPNTQQTVLQRYHTPDNGRSKIPSGPSRPLSDLGTIWDARAALANIADPTQQRNYGALASGGRHIITWLDTNHNGAVDNGEVQPFTPATFDNSPGYLGVSADKVAEVVHFIRGQEQPGTRSRTIDYDRDGIEEVWRLGDIVHSAPARVAAPAGAYDSRYGDSSYLAFKTHYQNRRQVVYVGANDGLLHAFNGGFWHEATRAYTTTGHQREVAHPLGSELWAYVPMNLLPHLRWLLEPDYPHVYYVDGAPQSFDVNIFTPDQDHPGGWGTILVVGMGLGGGAVDAHVAGKQHTRRSAYVVLDITNPEKPPTLLAEITHPQLGFTTAQPVLVKQRTLGTDQNAWYLVFGSGPTGSEEQGLRAALETGTSDQPLQVFAYDLKARSFVIGLDPLVTPYINSYSGAMTVADWDQDYSDDVVYFGTAQTHAAHLGGNLLRLVLGKRLSASQVRSLLDTGKPVLAAPLIVSDKQRYWVYAGTGRLLVSNDNRDRTQQHFYGIQEPKDSKGQLTWAPVDLNNIVDTSQVEILSSGTVRVKQRDEYKPVVIGTHRISHFNALQQVMKKQAGWRVQLTADQQTPSGRNLSTARRFFSMVLFTEYQPVVDSCQWCGTSYLHGLHYLTGTAMPMGVLGLKPLKKGTDQLSVGKINLGSGYASAPVLHQDQAGNSRVITQGNNGRWQQQTLHYEFLHTGRQSWRQIMEIPYATAE